MKRLELMKMDGLGNTFVVLLGPFQPTTKEVIRLCGYYGDKPADGLLVATAIKPGVVSMQYWNRDGLSAAMCGNGLRCLAKFSRIKKLVNIDEFVVETDVGPLKVRCEKDMNMVEAQIGKAIMVDKPRELFGEQFFIVNIGNVHAITFVENIDLAPVAILGPKVEVNACPPDRINVAFVEGMDSSRVKLRTWERGVGETLACGTSMAATSAVYVRYGHGAYPLTVDVIGGSAKLWIDEDGFTRMLGPVRFI